MDIYLNVTKEGTRPFRTGWPSLTECKVAISFRTTGFSSLVVMRRYSFLFNVTGSVVGQAAELSAFAPSTQSSKTQTSGSESCGGSAETAAEKVASFESDVLGLPWADGFTSSIASDTSHSFSTVQGRRHSQQLAFGRSRNVAKRHPIRRTIMHTASRSASTPVTTTNADFSAGQYSFPEQRNPSDGSTIHLGGSALSWNSPGTTPSTVLQTCASDSFDF